MKDVIIIGTGGHAKVVADIVLSSGDNLLGFLSSDRSRDCFLGRPVLGNDSDYQNFPNCSFVIAIGSQQARERIAEAMPDADWYTAIHPRAVISSLNVEIGEGTTIMANAVVNPCARIGRHCIINSAAVVEHDNVIADFAHISVGVKLAGGVQVGQRCFVGVGAAACNGVSICGDCTVGAGAVVTRNLEEPGTYVGVPARKIK